MAGLMVQRKNIGWGLRVGDLYCIHSYPVQQKSILAYHCGHVGFYWSSGYIYRHHYDLGPSPNYNGMISYMI